jgi:hypothetical protein
MSKGGIWGSGVLLSTVLEGWERAVRVFRRFAVGIAGQSRTIRQENSSAVARPTNDFKMVRVDLRGGIAEFEKFTKAMRIGDRVRAFCDDGVIEAEKVSQTRFKLIYSVETTGPIQ